MQVFADTIDVTAPLTVGLWNHQPLLGDRLAMTAFVRDLAATYPHWRIWVDVAKAKEAALAQADAGVDFWIECGEGPALGAIEAAKESDGYVTGYVGDMTENGPDVVLVNLVWNLEPMFAQMLEGVREEVTDYVFRIRIDTRPDDR